MNLKKIVADFAEVDENKILNSPKKEMGDFCLPCFEFAKTLHKAPQIIADELKQKLFLKQNFFIDRLETMGGYLNFFINKSMFAKTILEEKGFSFEFSNIGVDKTACIEYCSPNLAKYMHIGHLTNAYIGESLQRIYRTMGYNVVRINYFGDYGTPFGKMIVAIQKWGNVEDVKNKGIEELQNLYIKFNQEETEELLNMARFASKQIEDQKGEEYELYKMITEIAKDDCKKNLAILGIDFDDWRGESTYNKDMPKILKELEQKNISRIGEKNAQIVDLNEYNLSVAVVKRGDDGTVYITRDLCAIKDRFERYNFDEMLYVVAVEQKLHFQQLIKMCELLGRPYYNKMQHISYGMFSTPEGKISSRKGKQALLIDIYNASLQKATNIIENKNFTFEDKNEIAKKVARSAIAFSILKIERNKDKIFDLKTAISFDGETAPYLQYTYARTCSLIRKFQTLEHKEEFSCDDDLDEIFENNFEIFKIISNFSNTIKSAYEQKEPCIIARELLDLAQSFNKFYSEVKIIDETNYARSEKLMKIVEKVKAVFEFGLPLVVVDIVEEM